MPERKALTRHCRDCNTAFTLWRDLESHQTVDILCACGVRNEWTFAPASPPSGRRGWGMKMDISGGVPRGPLVISALVRDAQPPQPWWRRKLRRALHVLRIRRIKPLWTPFAANGKLRDDLLAVRKVDGVWVPNPLPNEGFHPLGTMSED